MAATRSDKTKTSEAAGPDPAAAPARPDPKAAEAIGRALKAHYADLVQAPLPENLARLLAQFETSEAKAESKGSGDAVG